MLAPGNISTVTFPGWGTRGGSVEVLWRSCVEPVLVLYEEDLGSVEGLMEVL